MILAIGGWGNVIRGFEFLCNGNRVCPPGKCTLSHRGSDVSVNRQYFTLKMASSIDLYLKNNGC